jgi:SAM-dependent methyltransferase
MPIDEDTKRFYDATAAEAAGKWYPNDVLMPTIREFLSCLPPQPRILDLGCGPGRESMRLAAAGAHVLGLDFSEDFRDLDTRFGSFHGVFAAASIIHVPPDDLQQVLSRVAGVLEDGGYFLAIVQDGEGVRECWPVVDGQKLRRTVYLYRQEDLASASAFLVSCGELELANELVEQDWRAYLFRLSRPPSAT